jgi:hypothetical protein
MSQHISIMNRDNSLRAASGEQLLLLAVLSQGRIKPRIDRELDRRSVQQRVNRHIGRHSTQMQLAA